DLADGRDLVPAPGQEPVDPVGGAQQPEQVGGRAQVVAPEEEVEEQRQAQQPDDRDQVRDSENPVFRGHRRSVRTAGAVPTNTTAGAVPTNTTAGAVPTNTTGEGGRPLPSALP